MPNREERARRRARRVAGTRKAVGESRSIAAELAERDARDRTRVEAPLVQAPDAQMVDTTGLSIEEVEEVILGLVRARISNGKEARRMNELLVMKFGGTSMGVAERIRVAADLIVEQQAKAAGCVSWYPPCRK